MTDLILINDKTLAQFCENIKNRQFMVCFCYKRYSIGKKAYICLDVAQTNYYGVHQFSIVARGTTYLDDMATIHYPLDRMVQSEIHSFIECDKPQIKPKG